MMRNLNRKLVQRREDKKQALSLDLISSKFLYGLKFFASSNELIDGTEKQKSKPNITVDGNDIYFDYSSVSSTEQRNILELKFRYANSGDSFTVSDGPYSDPSRSIDNVNISGTYLFQEFLSNNIIKAKINSADLSGIKKFYNTNFKNVPQITFSSNVKGNEKVYGVKNYLGNSSTNSFITMNILNKDYLRFSSKQNSKTFKVKNYYRINGVEYLFFEESCISENNFAESIFVEHYREKSQTTSTTSTPQERIQQIIQAETVENIVNEIDPATFAITQQTTQSLIR